jgi:hypothetical protein
MTPDEKRLLKHYRALSDSGRASLQDYAEFLASRDNGQAAAIPEQPLDIPRPAEESVVKAIKRLMATYPMLERDKLLNETSALMTRHVVHKHPAAEVIDELENFFRRQYDLRVQARNEPEQTT